MANIKYINAQELDQLCTQCNNLIICDVREAHEYEVEHIKGAINVPLSEFEAKLPEINNDNTYVFHCLGGKRTLNNEDKFKNLSCSEVLILGGGINEWKEFKK